MFRGRSSGGGPKQAQSPCVLRARLLQWRRREMEQLTTEPALQMSLLPLLAPNLFYLLFVLYHICLPPVVCPVHVFLPPSRDPPPSGCCRLVYFLFLFCFDPAFFVVSSVAFTVSVVPLARLLSHQVDGREYMETDEALYAALRKINRAGVVLLENVGVGDKTVLDLARRIAPISHDALYGEVFDVISQVGERRERDRQRGRTRLFQKVCCVAWRDCGCHFWSSECSCRWLLKVLCTHSCAVPTKINPCCLSAPTGM